MKRRLASLANLVLRPMGAEIVPYRPRTDEKPGDHTSTEIVPCGPRTDEELGDHTSMELVKSFEDPNHPIFRKSNWHYAFRLSDGTLTPTHTSHLREWNDLRRQLIFDQIESELETLKGKRCLDIACNAGFWSIELAKRGAKVEGFDNSKTSIEQAKAISAHNKISNVSFTVDNLFTYEPKERFDLILCCGLLYHLTDPLRACQRILKWSRGVTIFDTAVSDLGGAVLEIGSHDKYICCAEGEFAFVPTTAACEAIFVQAGFSKLKRVVCETGAYSEGHVRALWLAWP